MTNNEYVFNYYLDYKSDLLGVFFDACINVYNKNFDDSQEMFLDSDYPARIEDDDATVVLGLSGLDLINKIQFEETKKDIDYEMYPMERYFFKSPEYWAGWILAHYQDFSKKSFKEILDVIPINEIADYYYPYHEADVSKSYRLFDSLMNKEMWNRGVDYD